MSSRKRKRYRATTRLKPSVGEILEKAAEEQGLSVYAFIRHAILKELIALGYLDENTTKILELGGGEVIKPKPKRARSSRKR